MCDDGDGVVVSVTCLLEAGAVGNEGWGVLSVLPIHQGELGIVVGSGRWWYR